MTFSTEIAKRVSTTGHLISVVVAYDFTSILETLTPVGGVYENLTFGRNEIFSIQQNGTLLTEISPATLSSGEWYKEGDDLFIYPSATPDDENIVIIRFYLLLSSEPYVDAYLLPTTSSGELYPWMPRLTEVSSLQQDIGNNLSGILSISGGSFSIANTDKALNQYFSVNHSWNNAPIKVFTFAGDPSDVANVKLAYVGRITDLGEIGDRINVNFTDEIGLLNQVASFGDSVDEMYFTEEAFPNVDPSSVGAPIRFVFGSTSKFRHTISGTLVPGELVDPESMLQAVCTDYSDTISSTTNRVWGCCRVEDWENFSSSISAVAHNVGINTQLQVNYVEPNVGQFWHGDTFQITGGGLASYKVLGLTRLSAYTHTVFVDYDGTLTTSDTIVGNAVPGLWLWDDGTAAYYALRYGVDYTASATTTSGGNKYLSVTLVNNFEATRISDGLPINPSTDRLFFRVHPKQGLGPYANKDQRHGSVMQFMLEKAGLTVNSAAITSINTALPTNCCFSVPYFDQSEAGPYVEYIEKILESTFSYLAQDANGAYIYALLTKPTGGGFGTVTDDMILRDSFGIAIDYQDIVSAVITYNPNYDDKAHISQANTTATQSKESLRARFLYRVDNVLNISNIVEDMAGTIDRILGIRSERAGKYEFKLKNFGHLHYPGGIYLLSKQGLLGIENSRYVRISKTVKDKNYTQIAALDLHGG